MSAATTLLPCRCFFAGRQLMTADDCPEHGVRAQAPASVHEYAFDAFLVATVRVKARDEKEARAKLREALEGADCNAGMLDGQPLLFEAGLNELRLFEVDGQ